MFSICLLIALNSYIILRINTIERRQQEIIENQSVMCDSQTEIISHWINMMSLHYELTDRYTKHFIQLNKGR